MRLPYTGQFVCLVTDHLVWLVFSIIVIYFSLQQVQISIDNFAIVQGTDDVMQWWFYLATPIGFGLVMYRVFQNLVEDIRRYVRNEPMPVKLHEATD